MLFKLPGFMEPESVLWVCIDKSNKSENVTVGEARSVVCGQLSVSVTGRVWVWLRGATLTVSRLVYPPFIETRPVRQSELGMANADVDVFPKWGWSSTVGWRVPDKKVEVVDLGVAHNLVGYYDVVSSWLKSSWKASVAECVVGDANPTWSAVMKKSVT